MGLADGDGSVIGTTASRRFTEGAADPAADQGQRIRTTGNQVDPFAVCPRDSPVRSLAHPCAQDRRRST